MPEENIYEERSADNKVESAQQEVNENISQEQTIENAESSKQNAEGIKQLQPETANSKLQTEEMEVHHHPHVEKKNLKEYFFEGLMIYCPASSPAKGRCNTD